MKGVINNIERHKDNIEEAKNTESYHFVFLSILLNEII